MKITIRRAEVRDAKAIHGYNIALQQEIHDLFKSSNLNVFAPAQLCDEAAHSVKDFEKWIGDMAEKNDLELDRIWYVAEVENEVVGEVYAEMKTNKGMQLKTYGYIDSLFVEPRYRMNGIGSKLVEQILKWLKSKKVSYVSLDVDIVNKPANTLYVKYGFKTIKQNMSLFP